LFESILNLILFRHAASIALLLYHLFLGISIYLLLKILPFSMRTIFYRTTAYEATQRNRPLGLR